MSLFYLCMYRWWRVHILYLKCEHLFLLWGKKTFTYVKGAPFNGECWVGGLFPTGILWDDCTALCWVSAASRSFWRACVYDINHQFWTWHRGRNMVWPHLCSLLLGWIPAVWSMLQVWWSKIILMVSTQKSWWNKIYILFFESILESIFENLQQTSQRELSEVFISLEISIASDTVAVKVPPCLFSKWLKKLN